MKALTLEETGLKEELKRQYYEKEKDKFKMLCHLEDFEVQYWELQKENEILKQNAENNDKAVDKVNWENQLLKKENQELKDKIPYIIQNNSCKYISIEKCKNKVCVNYKMQELERGEINE